MQSYRALSTPTPDERQTATSGSASSATMSALIQAAGETWRPRVTLALRTGLLMCELRALHWQDVALAAGSRHRGTYSRHDVSVWNALADIVRNMRPGSRIAASVSAPRCASIGADGEMS
jgi:integrase